MPLLATKRWLILYSKYQWGKDRVKEIPKWISRILPVKGIVLKSSYMEYKLKEKLYFGKKGKKGK